MHPAAIAVIVVLVILIGVYVVTRGLPGPNPPPGPCKTNSDCPSPQTCVNGACVDTALPGLIQSAQQAIGALYGTLQNFSSAFANTYYQHATSLQAAAVAMGLSSPPLGSLQADLTAGQGDITKVLRYYNVPSCDPTRSTSCGYYAQMMAMTPSTPAGVILAVSGAAQSAVAELPVATAAFPPVAADLGDVVNFVTADAQAKGKSLDTNTQNWVNTVNADIGALNDTTNPTGTLATQAKAVTQTGYALYSHMLS